VALKNTNNHKKHSLALKSRKKSYKKKQWRPPSKKKKGGKNLSPRSRKACIQ
jgi:hypothetical protein